MRRTSTSVAVDRYAEVFLSAGCDARKFPGEVLKSFLKLCKRGHRRTHLAFSVQLRGKTVTDQTTLHLALVWRQRCELGGLYKGRKGGRNRTTRGFRCHLRLDVALQ